MDPVRFKAYFEDNLKRDVLDLEYPHTFRSAVLDGHLFKKIVAKYVDSDEHTDKAQRRSPSYRGSITLSIFAENISFQRLMKI